MPACAPKATRYLIDRKCLEVGDSWEHKIGTWLDRCHAAIVLFTDKALKSDYVKFEVGNLLHRWHRAGGPTGSFHLLPVLVEKLTEKQLKGFYSTINLWAIQRLGPDKNDVVIKALVAKLKAANLKAAGGGADSRLETDVAAILNQVRDDDALTKAAADAGIDTTDWPAANVAMPFARALVSSTMATAWEVVKALRVPLGPSRARDLFDLLMPCWVGAESARSLDDVTKAKAGTRCALVDAASAKFTPAMYLRRAKARLPKYAGVIVEVRTGDIGTNVEAGLRNSVRRQLAVALDVDNPAREFPTSVEKQLRLRGQDEPVIVAVRLDAKLLPAMCAVAKSQEFEMATFLAVTKPAPVAADAKDVTILRPLLPEDLEDKAYNQHFTFTQVLGGDQ